MPTSSLGHTAAGGGKSKRTEQIRAAAIAKLEKTVKRGEDAVKKEEDKKK